MAAWLGFALGCAALGPEVLHTALAAAAGTLFEAAPFLLASELAPRRVRALLPLAGCGCRGRLPGAVSLAATALCWLAFGPTVALARLAAGLALVAFSACARRERGSSMGDRSVEAASAAMGTSTPTTFEAHGDAVEELLVLAPAAAIAVTASGLLAAAAPGLMAEPLGAPVAFVAGLALGASAPCATAGVAIAAALAPHLAPAAAGVLLTSGLVRTPLPSLRGRHTPPDTDGRSAGTSVAVSVAVRLALAAALATLVQRGAGGFVNPRLLPLIAAGVVLALWGAGRRVVANARPQRPRIERGGRKRFAAALVPTIMLAALVSGSPIPVGIASATQLADAYPGARLSFVGPVHRSGATSVLERYQITCCRADASPVVVRLTSRLRVTDGTWVAASGVLEPSERGLELRVEHWHSRAAPRDPFLYR